MSRIVLANEIILKKLQELGPLPFSVEKQKKGTYFPKLAVICEIFN